MDGPPPATGNEVPVTERNLQHAEVVARPKCDGCGGWLLPDFHVPDHIWRVVVDNLDDALCLRCFDERATERGVAWEVEGVSFFPASGQTWQSEADLHAVQNAASPPAMSARDQLWVRLALRLLWRCCPTGDERLLGAMTDLATALHEERNGR